MNTQARCGHCKEIRPTSAAALACYDSHVVSVRHMTIDQLLMNVTRRGVKEEIERRRIARERLNQRIAEREQMIARSRPLSL